MAIECEVKGCTHSILGTEPGIVCRKAGGAKIWAGVMEKLLETGKWPEMDSILWTCGNCLTGWKEIRDNFCCQISPQTNFCLNL